MTKFVFDAATFVCPGHETDPGDWSDETRGEIAKLRDLYPELAHWGDLALGCAFGEMSEDVLSVSWAHWLFETREEFFLGYCYWRQTRGEWHGGIDLDRLERTDDWKSA